MENKREQTKNMSDVDKHEKGENENMGKWRTQTRQTKKWKKHEKMAKGKRRRLRKQETYGTAVVTGISGKRKRRKKRPTTSLKLDPFCCVEEEVLQQRTLKREQKRDPPGEGGTTTLLELTLLYFSLAKLISNQYFRKWQNMEPPKRCREDKLHQPKEEKREHSPTSHPQGVRGTAAPQKKKERRKQHPPSRWRKEAQTKRRGNFTRFHFLLHLYDAFSPSLRSPLSFDGASFCLLWVARSVLFFLKKKKRNEMKWNHIIFHSMKKNNVAKFAKLGSVQLMWWSLLLLLVGWLHEKKKKGAKQLHPNTRRRKKQHHPKVGGGSFWFNLIQVSSNSCCSKKEHGTPPKPKEAEGSSPTREGGGRRRESTTCQEEEGGKQHHPTRERRKNSTTRRRGGRNTAPHPQGRKKERRRQRHRKEEKEGSTNQKESGTPPVSVFSAVASPRCVNFLWEVAFRFSPIGWCCFSPSPPFLVGLLGLLLSVVLLRRKSAAPDQQERWEKQLHPEEEKEGSNIKWRKGTQRGGERTTAQKDEGRKFPSPVGRCCLPSPPLDAAVFPSPTFRWCCFSSTPLLGGAASFPPPPELWCFPLPPCGWGGREKILQHPKQEEQKHHHPKGGGRKAASTTRKDFSTTRPPAGDISPKTESKKKAPPEKRARRQSWILAQSCHVL